MNTEKTIRRLGMFATALLTTSALATTVMAAPVVTCPDTGATQVQTDLTVAGTTTAINGAIYTSVDTNGSVGTGVFPSFVRIQGNDCIQGYNTDGTQEFDTQNSPLFAIPLAQMELVTVNGIGYVEFHLDINQNKNNDGPSGPSLDNVQLFISTDNTLTGWTDCNLGGISCVYNMDAGGNRAILLDYVLNKGSGNGYDMQLLVPVSVFGSVDSKVANYVYLYSSFGAVGGNFAENDGFEEWQYRTCGNGIPCVVPPSETVPEPGSIVLLGLGLAALSAARRKRTM